MPEIASPARGRPRRYTEYEQLLSSLDKGMKRPSYVKNIGIMRGMNRDTVYAKICLKHGGSYRGKTYSPGQWIEINLGKLSSFNWQQLEDKRDNLQGKADRNEPLETVPNALFSDYADQWYERAKVRLRGHKTAKIHINKHLKPEFGDKALDHISTADVNKWIADALDNLKPSTVKRMRDTLQVILNDAMRTGLIKANPCAQSDNIKGIVGRERFLNLNELIVLYAKAKEIDEKFADFLLWCVHSGMRKSEILSLQWSDIRELPNGKLLAIIRISKSDKSRMVTCTPTMMEIIKRQKKKNKTDYVFPIARTTLKRRWEKVREVSNIPDVTIHDLRRTHSTHLAASGVDLRTLAGRIGHSNLTMLHKYYAVITDTGESHATKVIEQVFSGMIKKNKSRESTNGGKSIAKKR